MASRPEGKFVVSSIWIYKNKYTKQGSWFVLEIINYSMTYSIDQIHFSSEVEVYIEKRTTHIEYALYELMRNPYIRKYIYIRCLKIT